MILNPTWNTFETFRHMNVFSKDNFFFKSILFDTDTGYLLRYKQANSAITYFSLYVHPQTASGQCILSRAYLLIAIDYYYFMLE